MKKIIRRFARLGLVALALASLAQADDAEQQKFTSPKEAVKAVIHACAKNDINALLKIFGTDGKDIVMSGDPSDDADRRATFAKLAGEKYKLNEYKDTPDKIFVSIGKHDWPFPVPLVRKDDQWFFDSAEGAKEILARRIGANELDAIEICRGYAEAQSEYAQSHRTNGVPEYAQKIVSAPGKPDGLYWQTGKDGVECQVPKGFADAAAGMSLKNREPYHGYYFRILKAQGASARGGAVNYVVNGSMIGGFALVAWPAEYGVSGVQTFIVNHDGVVYEAHLGPETGRIAAEMSEFNPDSNWTAVKP